MVAKGFHQQDVIDYTETFSSMVKPTTIQFVLSLTITHGWKLYQIDIQNAFLHGPLSETIFMQQLLGFAHPKFPNYVCKLKKAIYGLKQAPRAWFSALSSWLTSYGFFASQVDPFLFIMHIDSTCIFILVYVDDMIITLSSAFAVDQLLDSLNHSFPVKNLDQPSYFLGIE